MKHIVGELLETKSAQWAECRALCASRLREMAEYFMGGKALTRVKQDDRMTQWFASLATEVRNPSDGLQRLAPNFSIASAPFFL